MGLEVTKDKDVFLHAGKHYKYPIDKITGEKVERISPYAKIAPYEWFGVLASPERNGDGKIIDYHRCGVMVITEGAIEDSGQGDAVDNPIDLGMAFDEANPLFEFRVYSNSSMNSTTERHAYYMTLLNIVTGSLSYEQAKAEASEVLKLAKAAKSAS